MYVRVTVSDIYHKTVKIWDSTQQRFTDYIVKFNNNKTYLHPEIELYQNLFFFVVNITIIITTQVKYLWKI